MASLEKKFNLLTLAILVALVSFYLNFKGIKKDVVATFYSPQTRFWELLSGSILAWFALYKKDSFANYKLRIDGWLVKVVYRENVEADGKTLSNVIAFVGSLLLIHGFWRITKDVSFPGKWAVIPVFGAVLIIAAGPKTWINRKILSNKIAVWFGLISFPLYLWHWPLLSFARIVESEVPSRNIRIAALVLSVVLAWLTYKLIERPIRLGKGGKAKVFVLVVLMAIVGYLGYKTYERDGLKFRSFNKINDSVNSALSYDWSAGFRFNECFIYALDEKTNKFSPVCGLIGSKNKPMLMIWGDSHSASLYRGFEKFGNTLGFVVSQFNASGCPPVLDLFIANRKECVNTNNYVFNEIKKLKPDVLVLGANWEMYNGDAKTKWEKLDSEKFISTIIRIKEAGVKNIIIIGQLPVYSTNQADMLKRKFLWTKVETVTYRNFKTSAMTADNNMRDLSFRLGVHFISPLDLLCKPQGCTISIPGDKITPLSYDYGHLTTVGSWYLVSKFFQNSLIKFPD